MNPIVRADISAITTDSIVADGAATLSGSTIVIAGAGGLIARYTALAMAELSGTHRLGATVICLVRDRAKAERTYAVHPAGDRISLVAQTLGEPLRYDGPADVIIHAGGGSSPHAYRADPYGVAAANARAAFDLVDFARSRGTRRIGYLSSREVYGLAPPAADGRISEAAIGQFDHLQPRNAYPESKRMAETVLKVAGAQFGLPCQLWRLASVYGPGMHLVDDGRAMADLVSARLAGTDLRLAGDGSTVRGYCYVTDAVRGILTALLTGADGEAYNIANETEPVSIRQLADLLAQTPVPAARSGGASDDRRPRVILGTEATPAGYSTFGYIPLSTAKLAALGWAPQVSLQAGLHRTLEGSRVG